LRSSAKSRPLDCYGMSIDATPADSRPRLPPNPRLQLGGPERNGPPPGIFGRDGRGRRIPPHQQRRASGLRMNLTMVSQETPSARSRSLSARPAPSRSYSRSYVLGFLILLLTSVLGFQRLAHAQEVSVKLGLARTIKSAILNEDRRVLVHLPAGYDTSGASYPVLYLLDGTEALLFEMIGITDRLRYDHYAPEMIIIAIENTNRDRDMMPVVAKDYPGPPRAKAFLAFLEKELIPDIDKTYRTTQPRILQGKSLSGLFTVYALLARPIVFNAYVGCSAGWFAENNAYFLALSNRAFREVGSFANRRVFMANSLRDQYDPDQVIHRQMVAFSALLKGKLGHAIAYRYETYQDYPHVPFPCLYDGLRFVSADQRKK
jgi:predicted alpha/beta superfamily hydrolase